MNPQSRPVPLDLVTGFLGSGKTTLINAALRDAAFAGTVVVVNEFGAVGLDQLLVGSATDNVVLLDSGCLCCAVSGSLRDTLIDLFSRRASGSLPPFGRIIVETSGIANPAPMVAALLSDSALTPRCALALVLTLVDSRHGLSTLERYPEARRQVALADRVLISKSDQLEAARETGLRTALRNLNPHAPIELWCVGDPPSPPFDEAPACGWQDRHPQTWLRGPVRAQYGAAEPLHGEAFGKLSTHVLTVGQAIDWPEYAAWTAELRGRFGTRLLRCKGLLPIGPEGLPWIVQGVQGHFAPPRRLESPARHSPGGFLVCIGESITRDELEATQGSLLV